MSAEDQRDAEKFEIAKLKAAKLALFTAAVSLPFDIYETLPDKGKLADRYIERCAKWHDAVGFFYNSAVKLCSANIHPDKCNSDMIPVSALIGYPPPFDDRVSSPAVPPTEVATITDRIRRESFLEGMELEAGISRRKVTTDTQQARSLCLELRKRALELDEWLRKAIKTFYTALLPAIELGEQGRNGRRAARVCLAGDTKPVRFVRSKSEQALLSFKRIGEFMFSDRKELARFVVDFKELKHHLKRVAGKEEGRPVRSLSEEMRARITESTKKPQT